MSATPSWFATNDARPFSSSARPAARSPAPAIRRAMSAVIGSSASGVQRTSSRSAFAALTSASAAAGSPRAMRASARPRYERMWISRATFPFARALSSMMRDQRASSVSFRPASCAQIASAFAVNSKLPVATARSASRSAASKSTPGRAAITAATLPFSASPNFFSSSMASVSCPSQTCACASFDSTRSDCHCCAFAIAVRARREKVATASVRPPFAASMARSP